MEGIIKKERSDNTMLPIEKFLLKLSKSLKVALEDGQILVNDKEGECFRSVDGTEEQVKDYVLKMNEMLSRIFLDSWIAECAYKEAVEEILKDDTERKNQVIDRMMKKKANLIMNSEIKNICFHSEDGRDRSFFVCKANPKRAVRVSKRKEG